MVAKSDSNESPKPPPPPPRRPHTARTRREAARTAPAVSPPGSPPFRRHPGVGSFDILGPGVYAHALQGTARLYQAPDPRRPPRPQSARVLGSHTVVPGSQRPQTACRLGRVPRPPPLIPATAAGIAAATAPGATNLRLKEELIRLALRISAASELKEPALVGPPSASLCSRIACQPGLLPGPQADPPRITDAPHPPRRVLQLTKDGEVEVSPRLYPGRAAQRVRRRHRYVKDPSCQTVIGVWTRSLRMHGHTPGEDRGALSTTRWGMVRALDACTVAAICVLLHEGWQPKKGGRFETEEEREIKRADRFIKGAIAKREKAINEARSRFAELPRGRYLRHPVMDADAMHGSVDRLCTAEMALRQKRKEELARRYLAPSAGTKLIGARRLSPKAKEDVVWRLTASAQDQQELTNQFLMEKYCTPPPGRARRPGGGDSGVFKRLQGH
eukprot:Hpha_TRINITY_DN30388_c0_g1::TRINITY_DN30388_c0_g1_i1::g.147093::m.147093